MPGLTKAERDALPADAFAVPGKRLLPLHDAKHVGMAWTAVSTAKGLSDAERATARRRILAAAATHKVDTAGWNRLPTLAVQAMSLELPPADDHPNRIPFSGVLVRLDEPSDNAPGGSGGRRIILSSDAARAALPSLLGMAVNTTFDFDGHYPQNKVGLITGADIVDGAIVIEGFIYAADFPETADAIRAFKDALGFSFEAQNIYVADPVADPLTITALVFTGASILRKDKAAYTSTSLAASKAETQEYDPMDLKEIADAIGALGTRFDKVEADIAAVKASQDAAAATAAARFARADKLEAEAAELDKEGLKDAASQLRATAASLRGAPAAPVQAQAAPAAKTDADIAAAVKAAVDAAVAPLNTKIADLTAAAAKAAPAPERKTLPPAITAILARADLSLADGEKISVAKLDEVLAKANLNPEQRIAAKTALSREGLIG